MTEAERIAAGLTKAQREGMLRQPCPSWWGPTPAAFPHTRQTTFALHRKDLCKFPLLSSNASALTPLGREVRVILAQQNAAIGEG